MNITPIRPGDIVEIDGPNAKGSDGDAVAISRFYALVVDNPGGQLVCRRTDGKLRQFNARPRLVIGHWRRSAATIKQHERLEARSHA